ncbi:MAG: UvrD-helicase domain-containing protein [Chloroflexi bacterium]|nr:UvrD-helicase domain-containing protein [Chloroflexota bacterium]
MPVDILDALNPSQRQAVTAIEGPVLIVAGPGSGKTRVIVHRIAYLVDTVGVSPHRICAVTFTNRAAREMRARLQALLGSRAEQLTCGTFHALCAAILRRDGEAIGLAHNYVIYDEEDQGTVIKQAMEEAKVDPRRFPPHAVHEAISAAKAQLLDVEGFRLRVGSYYDEVVLRVYERYQALLVAGQAVDFDDLLLKTFVLLRDHADVLEKYQGRYLHLLIDEFQDTNVAQYQIARQLAGKYRNICVVGDPDQSIYSWRHADLRNILSFQKDYADCRVVHLGENYRSTQTIVAAAQKVIATNRQRLENPLHTSKGQGAPIVAAEAYNEEEEANWVVRELDRLHRQERVPYSACAAMYRVNAQSRALEEACLRYGIPYHLVGALRFYHRKEVKDVVAYLRLVANPADEVSLLRVLNVPPRGIGQKTQDQLVRWARGQGVSALDALGRLSSDEQGAALIPSSGRAALLRFHAMVQELRQAAERLDVVALMDLLLERAGYRQWLLEETEDGQERWENITELRGTAEDFRRLGPQEGLAAFLEGVALVSDQDNAEADRDAMTLITLHQAKGLEFPAVFIVGLEEGLLPHSRSLDDPAQLEEERRLFYVGMTRAKERLYLLRAFRRRFRGSGMPGEPNTPSRFLRDIPSNLIAMPLGSGAPSLIASRRPRDEAAVTPATQAAPPPRPPLKTGDRVRHAKFGEGIVVSCTRSGGDHEVTVAFQGAGVKRLLYSLAPLEKVEMHP